jgi:hypothetical protein
VEPARGRAARAPEPALEVADLRAVQAAEPTADRRVAAPWTPALHPSAPCTGSSARRLRTAAVVWRARQAAAGLSTSLGKRRCKSHLWRALHIAATGSADGRPRCFRAAHLPHALVALARAAQRRRACRSHARDGGRKGLTADAAVRGRAPGCSLA